MKKLFMFMALILGLATTSSAAPIVNVAGDGFEDRSTGAVFGHFENSGTLMFTASGNNIGSPDTLTNTQQLVRDFLGDQSFTLGMSDDVAFTSHDGNSGTWETVPPLGPAGTIDFYAVKAGNYFAMYLVNPAASTGSWSTISW